MAPVDFDSLHRQIFREGSRTFSSASRLFPRSVRRDVATLYAFLRVADNLVDDPPVQPDEFGSFCRRWREAWDGKPAGDGIIDPFVELCRRVSIDRSWVDDFLSAMESDLAARPCDSLDDVLRYTWGSAEVVGLCVLRVLGIGDEAQPTARLMGRSMQFINILRDVGEDYGMGRRYLPLAGLAALSPEAARADPEAFRAFMRGWTQVYGEWQRGAVAGYPLLPWRFRWAVKTASDLYNWTARVIAREPMIVWTRRVKPSGMRILLTAAINLFTLPRGRR
jgi:phytoene synthase